jgi:DNA-binding LacI/PurR family transcriptional regulator
MSNPSHAPGASLTPAARDIRRISVMADVAPETVRAAYADPAHVHATTHARVEVAARALNLALPPARARR